MDKNVIDRVREVIDAASMTQAAFAERVGLTPDKLSKSLGGVRRFTSVDLALIAEAGGRTVDWLLTGREPLRPALAARTRTGSAPQRVAAQDVAQRFTAAYEVLELLGRSPALPPMPSAPRTPSARKGPDTFTEQGERLADDALTALRSAGVESPAGQGTDALIAAIERCFGVDVAIVDLPDATDGLAWQADDAFRLVLVARTDLWTRQRFTLAHELGHILARDAQDALVESHVAPGRQKDLTEVRANAFASSLLMPAAEVTDALRDISPSGTPRDEEFHRLVVRFRVSPSALAARLLRLGVIEPEARKHLRGFTTEMSHLLAGTLADYQTQEARASAERVPSRVASELFKAYLDGETTLRPLAAMLGTDVDRLHDLVDPGSGAGPNSMDEDGDLVFQP